MTTLRDRAIKTGQLACQLDGEKKYEEALQTYIKAIELFNQVIKSKIVMKSIAESNAALANTLKGKAQEYLERALKLKEYIKGQKGPSSNVPTEKPEEPNKTSNFDLPEE